MYMVNGYVYVERNLIVVRESGITPTEIGDHKMCAPVRVVSICNVVEPETGGGESACHVLSLARHIYHVQSQVL